MLKRLSRHPRTQIIGAWLLGAYLRFVFATTRWQWEGEENLAPFWDGAPVIGAFWHECLPLMPALWLRLRRANPSPCHVVISRHRDGRLIATLMYLFGARTLNGSSSRGGAAVVREALRILEDGGRIVITPDGPRGPRRQAAPGAAALAALSGQPLLPCAARTSRRLILKSWDRMAVPLPFGRGAVVAGEVIRVGRDDMRFATGLLQDALTQAADRADRLCGIVPDIAGPPSPPPVR